MFKIIFASIFALFVFSCTTEPTAKEGVPTISINQYESLIEQKTKSTESYNGLANQLNASVTKLDTSMTNAILARSGQIYEWNSATFQEEKNKITSELTTKTQFFLSFYTPERNHNNLTASKPIWKIYLDVGGQRYEGKAIKIKSQLADLQVLYPHHNRFSSAYKIEFSVPTTQTENQPETFTITGPNASVKIEF